MIQSLQHTLSMAQLKLNSVRDVNLSITKTIAGATNTITPSARIESTRRADGGGRSAARQMALAAYNAVSGGSNGYQSWLKGMENSKVGVCRGGSPRAC